MKYQIIAKGAIYHVTIAAVIFSRVKISCFRAKAQLVFHWCLYYNNICCYMLGYLAKKLQNLAARKKVAKCDLSYPPS